MLLHKTAGIATANATATVWNFWTFYCYCMELLELLLLLLLLLYGDA